MPMNDAVALVGRSFEEYVDKLREKAKAATSTTSSSESAAKVTAAATTSQAFLAASSDVAYLLNLLADNQALTVSELEDVIEYLKRRRSKMIDAERKSQAINGWYYFSHHYYIVQPINVSLNFINILHKCLKS